MLSRRGAKPALPEGSPVANRAQLQLLVQTLAALGKHVPEFQGREVDHELHLERAAKVLVQGTSLEDDSEGDWREVIGIHHAGDLSGPCEAYLEHLEDQVPRYLDFLIDHWKNTREEKS